ncbi:hypothetical protein LB507_009104 [Fusarium sp. FIESC RH6]|nr:hypothetical protein LB507_009104 [Fusarium sp. FIESC RH6]
MPFYQIHHSCSLSSHQRLLLAKSITDLHCEAFNTPKFFVHVRFFPEDNKDNTYFVAGDPHPDTSNRIIGLVRTSASRSKEDFDKLAEAIEESWYEILEVFPPGRAGKWTSEDEKKRLMMVTFTPMVALREAGMTMPEAGHEENWMLDQSSYFEKMVNKGVPGFLGMLHKSSEM